MRNQQKLANSAKSIQTVLPINSNEINKQTNKQNESKANQQVMTCYTDFTFHRAKQITGFREIRTYFEKSICTSLSIYSTENTSSNLSRSLLKDPQKREIFRFFQ